jgi:predicted acetyltransferase
MTLSSTITLRSGTAADAPAVLLLLNASFGVSGDRDENEQEFDVFPLEDALIALDGDRIVGYSAARRQTVTVPGDRAVEVDTIASVSVAPSHRRRGILRAMYTEQHRRTEDAGLPLTMFTASQGGIYGRFGYGPGIMEHRIRFDRRFARFLPTTPDPGGVEVTPISVARQMIPLIHERWSRHMPGAQRRPDAAWTGLFADPVRLRGGGTEMFAFTHADGYVLYRYHRRDTGATIEVVELRAVTTEAHVALWRALAALELFDHIEATVAPDDPLPYLLTDPRLVYTTGRRDGIWLRLMDVPAALTARTYRGDLDLVLAVTDPFRDAGGAFALRVRDGIAECAPTRREPDTELGIDVLAALYLGAHRARTFAAAHRLHTKSLADLRALDHAFGADREPTLGWFF